eukprot:COSAG06_NODE_66187_length_255_cov_0.621795_2_plen_34_part_01
MRGCAGSCCYDLITRESSPLTVFAATSDWQASLT